MGQKHDIMNSYVKIGPIGGGHKEEYYEMPNKQIIGVTIHAGSLIDAILLHTSNNKVYYYGGTGG